MPEPLPITPAPIATITGDDLLKKLDRLTEAVSGVDRKIDPVIAAIADVKTDLADHETRIRAVESGHWRRIGASSLVSALLSSGIVVGLVEAVVHR